jgi:cytochrome P450
MTIPSDPSALLAWFGNTSFPDGRPGSASSTQDAFVSIHTRLAAASLHDPQLVPSLAAAQRRFGPYRDDNAVPIAVVDFRVAIADEAVARKVAASDTGPDFGALMKSARAPAPAFAASAMLRDQFGRAVPVHRGRRVTYLIHESFWFKAPDAELPQAIEVDAGDGLGFHEAAFGQAITATYPGDAATVTVRAHFSGGTLRTAQFELKLDAAAAPVPDQIWTLRAASNNGHEPASGRAWVYLGDRHGEVVNPLIIAEGFPGGYSPDYLYDILNQQGLADALRRRGYDVVFVGFDDGLLPMQENAGVVEACIVEATKRTNAPLVAGGLSMGGLVARYALASMEQRGVDHRTRLFVTIDTPHFGAYTSLSDQWFAHFFSRVSTQASAMSAALDSPSNQQFLKTWATEGGVIVSPLRTRFLADLAAAGGWPLKPKRIAVSCGHGRGAEANGNTAAGRRVTLEWTGSPFGRATLYTVAGDGDAAGVADGFCAAPSTWKSSLTYASPMRFEDLPGGTNMYTAGAAAIAGVFGTGMVKLDAPAACSVPTVSALAIDQDPTAKIPVPGPGVSPFDDFVCSEENLPHLTLTAAVADWLIARIGPPLQQSAGTTAAAPPPFDPATFDPHNPAFIADPYPTFTRFRQSHPVALVKPYQQFWVFKYAHVMKALNDPVTFPKMVSIPGRRTVLDAVEHLPQGIFEMNAPQHTVLRGALEGVLRPAFMAGAGYPSVIADELLAKLRASGTARFDLISSYALPLPAYTLFSIFELPRDHWDQLMLMIKQIQSAHDITQSAGVQSLGGLSVMALYSYLQGMMRGAPADSLFGRLVSAAAAVGFSSEAVQASCVNFLVAGFLSVTFLIGTGTLNLANNPAQLARLTADPKANIGPAIAEMLRHDAPAQIVDRGVAADTMLSGVKLPAGSHVSLILGSANRDETAFVDPDAFDIGRKPAAQPVPFGDGIHRCIGAPLVLLSAPVAIQKLVEAFPTLRVDGLVQWETDPYLRGPSNVPLAVD